jgi:lipid-A-disaccharide synthase
MKIFFSVGEPSGDLHGANVIRALRAQRADLEIVGFGGPRMAAEGCQLLADLTQYAVMWFLHVLLNIHRFWAFLGHAKAYFRDQRPDLVVLIDYPGFNFVVARLAKRHGIPVVYYGAPQMWAWMPWRVRKMRRRVDHVLCKLPFEAKWYAQRGCRATFVGHPFFDETHQREIDSSFVKSLRSEGEPLVTILPGSRTQEVQANLPSFLDAAACLHDRLPRVRFAIAAFNEKLAAIAREALPDHDLPIEIHVAKTPELIFAADACLACSGSVSLELLHHEKPTVILYRVNPAAYVGQRVLRRVKYITLVNLLASRDPFPRDLSTYDPDARDAERVPFPEYLTFRDVTERMANHIFRWLTNTREKEAVVAQLRRVKRGFAHPGASHKAAQLILEHLPESASPSRAHAA